MRISRVEQHPQTTNNMNIVLLSDTQRYMLDVALCVIEWMVPYNGYKTINIKFKTMRFSRRSN